MTHPKPSVKQTIAVARAASRPGHSAANPRTTANLKARRYTVVIDREWMSARAGCCVASTDNARQVIVGEVFDVAAPAGGQPQCLLQGMAVHMAREFRLRPDARCPFSLIANPTNYAARAGTNAGSRGDLVSETSLRGPPQPLRASFDCGVPSGGFGVTVEIPSGIPKLDEARQRALEDPVRLWG